MTIRIIKHPEVAADRNFEVRFSDGRPSVYFYLDDVASRRLSPEQMDNNLALEAAQALVQESMRLRGVSATTQLARAEGAHTRSASFGVAIRFVSAHPSEQPPERSFQHRGTSIRR